MSRRQHEQDVIGRFVNYLVRRTGVDWHPSPDEVSTFKNSRKYDCEFTFPGQVPIAADICSLFPLGSHQDDRAKRAKLIERLGPELVREGLGGLMIGLPPVQKQHARPDWPRKAASQIRAAVQQLPMRQCVNVEGFSIKRIADDSEPLCWYHLTFSAYQPIDAAGHALAVLLSDKHDQLDVDGHQRFLIVVNDGCRCAESDVSAGSAFIDFRQYPNFDRIFFEESPGNFLLVYDRKAWLFMEACKMPNDIDSRRLVSRWLEVRLSGHSPGALDAVLQIGWDRTEWLSEGGRALLELEVRLFLQNCAWDTPRQFWALFRGPVPRILDGRRRAQPIHAPAK
jgi:hypothetical protein